jgi:hypothetical protein
MSFKDISIGVFQRMEAAKIESGDNEWSQWTAIISILTGRSQDYYRAMKVDDFKKLVKQYDWVISEKMPTDWVKEFKCQGETFKVMQRTDQWDMGQFISMGTLTKDNFIENLHLIVAVLSVKEPGEVVPEHEYNRRAEMFRDHLDPVTAYPIGLFYAAVLAQLPASIRTSLGKRMKTAIKKRIVERIGLGRSGAGTK